MARSEDIYRLSDNFIRTAINQLDGLIQSVLSGQDVPIHLQGRPDFRRVGEWVQAHCYLIFVPTMFSVNPQDVTRVLTTMAKAHITFDTTSGFFTFRRVTQRQDSVEDQLRTVLGLATAAGCYDAVDLIQKILVYRSL